MARPGDSSTSSVGLRRSSSKGRALLLPVLHLLALWAFAVAQQLYDILRRNGEFFIAHRTQPLDLLLFAAVVSAGLPLIFLLPYLLVASRWPRSGRVVLTALVALLSTALASQTLAYELPLPTTAHFAGAGLLGGVAAWSYATHPAFRTFLTALSVSVPLFPALFLLHPSMAAFVRTDTRDTRAAAAIE